MSQTKLCDLVKKDDGIIYLKDYVKIVRKGKNLCNKCGRVAKDEKYLCKPVKLKKKSK